MINLLITGGSGYVGTRLINYLLKKKIRIFNYDIGLYGDDHLPTNKNLNTVKKDIRDRSPLKIQLKKIKLILFYI